MKTIIKSLCSTLSSGIALFSLIACSNSGGDQRQAVDADHVDETLAQLIESETLVGVSALVFEKGREVYFGAHGFADRESESPMRRDTLVYIYSMTKPITGVALMQLHEKGLFELDDPLEKHAPEFANLKVFAGQDRSGRPIYDQPRRSITIRDITRHTGGFADGDGAPDPIGGLYADADPMNLDNSLPEMAARLASVPLLYQPGTRWVYGPSVDIQAYLVEAISGQPFDVYLKENIFDPLQMNETRHSAEPSQRHRLATVYQREADGSFTPLTAPGYLRDAEAPALKRGGSGLISTLDDYIRFARMLLNGGELDGARILDPATIRLMATDALPEEIGDRSWLPSKGQVGFGIDFAIRHAPPIDANEASGEVGEFFWDGFASTLFWVDPANDIAAVFFTQYTPFGSVPVHKAFRDAVYRDFGTALAR